MVRLIIAGGRDYQFTPKDKQYLDDIHDEFGVECVISGCAKGADLCGEEWAKSRGIPVEQFPADWKTHGRAAGPIRNEQMAKVATAVVLFPGGTGTRSMEGIAFQYGLVMFKGGWS